MSSSSSSEQSSFAPNSSDGDYHLDEKLLVKTNEDEDDDNMSSESIYWNFVTMCIAFSFNHGCVVSCLAYSSAELGKTLGGYGSGVLYVFYATTALFLSKPLITSVGAKTGLLMGTGGYCCYVVAFLFAVVVPKENGFNWLRWVIFLVSCAIGGVSGGLLWTAQGRYFAKNATKYSAAMIKQQGKRQGKRQQQQQQQSKVRKNIQKIPNAVFC
jgi:hypothetical protein